MATRKTSSQNSLIIPDKSNMKRVCSFCNLSEDNELEYGKFYQHSGIITHYYCLLLSSNMEQKGSDDEGILGFLAVDIHKELRRGKRLVCSYCKKNGATLGCCNTKCKRIFHFPCGLKAGSLHQFFGEFRSYCIAHRPKQKIDERVKKEVEKSAETLCYICYDSVKPFDSNGTLWAPCCKKNAWFHRKCVQQLAMSAGYFFKCPLCNNKNEFQEAMSEYGIFIPRQDASWELVPNAFEELLYRYDRCDAEICNCPKGRMHTSNNAKWELILCRTCGSQGIHVACGNLKWTNPTWDCKECRGILHKTNGDTTETNESSNASSRSRSNQRMQASSSNTTKELEEHSDSDISVGDESVPILESESSTIPESPVVRLRPGPRSFKLQQVEKLKSEGNVSRNDLNASNIASRSSAAMNIPGTTLSLPEGISIHKTNVIRSVNQEVICLDSDDEAVEIVSERFTKQVRSFGQGETTIELVSGRKARILDSRSNSQMAGYSADSLQFTTTPMSGLSIEPVGNFPPLHLLESREGTINTNMSDFHDSNFDPSLAANANGNDSSSFSFVISNVTSVPPEFFASVPNSTDCIESFVSQPIQESGEEIVSLKDIAAPPETITNYTLETEETTLKRKADVVDLDEDDDDIQIVQQTKRQHIRENPAGASPSTSEETLPVQLIMESDFVLSKQLQRSLKESTTTGEVARNETPRENSDDAENVLAHNNEMRGDAMRSTVESADDKTNEEGSPGEMDSSTAVTIGSAEHSDDLSVLSSIKFGTSVHEVLDTMIPSEVNACTNSASVTNTPESFSDFLEAQFPSTSTDCHGDAGTSPADDAGSSSSVLQDRPPSQQDSKGERDGGPDGGDTADNEIFTSNGNAANSNSTTSTKSSDSSRDRTGLIESYVPLNELKFKLCGPDVVQVRCGSYILDIKMQNPIRARDACNAVETASSFTGSNHASSSATVGSGMPSRASSRLRQVDESTVEKSPEPGPQRRLGRFEYLDDMTLQEFPSLSSGTPRTPRSVRYSMRLRNNLKENMDPVISSSNETAFDTPETQSPVPTRVKMHVPCSSDSEVQSHDSSQTNRRSAKNNVRYFRSVVQQPQQQQSSDRFADSPGVSTRNQRKKMEEMLSSPKSSQQSTTSKNKHLKRINTNDLSFDAKSINNQDNDFKVSIDLQKIKHLIDENPDLFIKSNNNVYLKFCKYKHEEESTCVEESVTKSRSISSSACADSSKGEMDCEVTESTDGGFTESEKSGDERKVRRSQRHRIQNS